VEATLSGDASMETLWRGIEANKAFYFVRVKRQIKPRPDADFEHATLGRRNDAAAIGGTLDGAAKFKAQFAFG